MRHLLRIPGLCPLLLALCLPVAARAQQEVPATEPSTQGHEEGGSAGDDDDSAGDDDDSAADESSLQRPPFALAPAFPPSATHHEESQPAEIAPERAELSIIYEGATDGISGASADLWADETVNQALSQTPGGWARTQSSFSAFQREGRWLLMHEGGIERFRQDAAAGLVEQSEAAAEIDGLTGDDFAVIVWPKSAAVKVLPVLEQALKSTPLRPAPHRQPFRAVPQQSTIGDPLLLVGRPGDAWSLEQPTNPVDWEVRLQSVYRGLTQDGQPAWVHVVARLTGEGARRTELASVWRRSPSLYISAGGAVEGRSFLSASKLSLQRAHTWSAWKELGLTALAPGQSELLAGVETLKAEAKAADVILCSVNIADAEGNAVFDRVNVQEMGGRRVALLGWTDPEVASGLPPSIRNQLRIRGTDALYEVLAGLSESEAGEPDLVVLFGLGARKLAGHLPGVDVVLGDFTSELRLPRWEEVDESALWARSKEDPKARSPALVARLGPGLLGRIDLAFDGDRGPLRRMRHLRARLGEELPAAPRWVREVQRTRQDVYASLEEVLVPDLAHLTAPPAPPAWLRKLLPPRAEPAKVLDEGGFARLAANLLMERTGAQAALLRPIPHPVEVAGPTLELVVDASLAVPDEVVVVDLTGAQLKELVRRVTPVQPAPGQPLGGRTTRTDDRWAWAAGLQSAGGRVKVQGRPVADDDLIRLATTSFLTEDPALAPALKKAPIWRHFRGKGWRLVLVSSQAGSTWLLHDLVKGGLVELRQRDPNFGESYMRRIAPLMTDQSSQVSPRLTLELDGIALQITGSLPVGDRVGYENSRESRVQQQRSFTTAIRGRVAVVYDDGIGSALAYALAAFGQSAIAETDDPVEQEDDFQAGAEGRLKLVNLPFPRAPIRLSTFIQSAFDTEFVAGKAPSGETLPLQRLWRTTAGVALGKYLLFKEGRGGFFVEYDFEADVGPLSPGFTLGVLTEKRWGPIRWATLFDLKGYLPTPVDTEEDLLFTLQLRTDLGVSVLRRIFPGLSVGGFVDALFFQGKLPSNDQGGMHLLVGLSLSYDTDVRAPLPLR